MNLKELIKENWDKKEFMSLSLNESVLNEIMQATSFLDSYYSKIQLRNRAYECTEYEKAREMGFNKIYDCGTLCFGII